MDPRGRHRPTGLPAHSPLHRETSLSKKQLRTTRARELTVETGVEIALARRAFAGIADYARLFPPRSPFECIGGTSRLWELSPQRGRDGVEVMLARTVMDGHLSACRNVANGFSFKERFSGEEGPMELTFGCLVILGREDLGHEVRKTVVAKQSARSVQFPPLRRETEHLDPTQRIASPEEHSDFAVLCKHLVVVLPRSGGSDYGAFFAVSCHVKRNAALSLRRIQDLILFHEGQQISVCRDGHIRGARTPLARMGIMVMTSSMRFNLSPSTCFARSTHSRAAASSVSKPSGPSRRKAGIVPSRTLLKNSGVVESAESGVCALGVVVAKDRLALLASTALLVSTRSMAQCLVRAREYGLEES